MSFRELYDHRLWYLPALSVCAILLAACGTPTPPPTPTAIPPTPTQAPTPTPQLPPSNMENIIPKPVSLIATGGTFSLTADAVIYVNPDTDEVRAIGQYLADHLNPATGFDLQVQAATGLPRAGSLYLSLSDEDPTLGDEGYTLTITPELVKVTANKPAGLFYGVQTIRQLLPVGIDSASPQPGPWNMGTGTIRDYPRFTWRGTMLDVARHFFSVQDVIQYIDLLAYYKVNRLHLHLTDDQGWRIQIKSWPNLTMYGGSLEVGGTPGGYYTQDEYASLVAYAQSRYITIIPEIEMPGHVNAALASYGELTCDGIAPELHTGISVGFSSLCIDKDITYTFIRDVIGELAALTPGAYIHIGGDETQATDPDDYIRFVRQAQSIVQENGKQVIGWEEIAQSTIQPNSIVQHWNLGEGFAGQAVAQGAKVIMSPADLTYMDMKYTLETSLGLEWAGQINVEKAYTWDPATLLPDVSENDILGVEAPLWSETLNTLADVEYMAFPRILGYAEIGWSPQTGRDWNEYRLRLAAQGSRLDALGVNFYKSPEILWR